MAMDITTFPVPQEICENCHCLKSRACSKGIACLKESDICQWQDPIKVEKKPSFAHGRVVHDEVGSFGRLKG
jgi:hypothetical protein